VCVCVCVWLVFIVCHATMSAVETVSQGVVALTTVVMLHQVCVYVCVCVCVCVPD